MEKNKGRRKSRRKDSSPEKTIADMAAEVASSKKSAAEVASSKKSAAVVGSSKKSAAGVGSSKKSAAEVASSKRRTRQSDSSLSLPLRMFVRGHEPVNNKVNFYFSLNHLEVIKKALDEDQIHTLLDSQFGTLLGIGNKIAFSVKFAHFLLCRQVITKKTHEIWVLFGGQPIRFSLREFALATNLNCSMMSNEDEIVVTEETKTFSKELFGQDLPPTPKWIVEKLSGAPYRDRDTRMRLALLLIVDGVLCRTSGEAKISLESIEVVRDIDRFISHPWGRKSFDMTMGSIKSTLTHKYTQPSAAIQGFPHALQMVVLACSPNILTTDPGVSSCTGSEDEESYSVQGGVTKPINLYMPLVRRLDNDNKGRQGDVISIMQASSLQRGLDKLIVGGDLPDPSVDDMLSIIRSGHKFTHESWRGGIKAADVLKPRKVEEGESSHFDIQKIIADVGDACYARVKALTDELAGKMQDMIDYAITSIETDMVLKFSHMETIIEGLHDLHRPSCPTSTPPHPFCEPNSSFSTPNDPNSNHLSDDGECDRTPPGPHGSKLNHVSDESQKIDADLVQSPDTMVRNVVADINAMAVEDSMGRDGSRSVVEPVLEDVEDTLNEVAVEGKREKNSTLGDDKSPHEPDPITNEDLTSPNVKCPEDVLVSPEFNLMHQDEEEQVIMLGYTGVFEVPEVQDPIQPSHTDGGESPNVMESTGPVQEGDVDMQPPTNDNGESSNNELEATIAGPVEPNVNITPSFSLGLTQEIQKRKLFNQVYTRKSKRAKHTSSSLNDFVVDIPGKGKQCVVTTMFPQPGQENVDMINKLMEMPSYFPTYDGHTLVESSFLELLAPASLTSTLVMDTLVSYLHNKLVDHSTKRDSTKYDFLDCTFLNDIGLLHELIQPEKHRKKIVIKQQLCDYVKSRRNLYTEVETLLCPFLLEDKHWVGVVVNLSEHELVVLDCNPDVVETPIVEALLTPFASALPYVTRQLAYNSEMRHDSLEPFAITRPPIKTRLTDPELSGIASIMLMLLHANDMLDDQIELTRNQVENASQNYAVQLFHAIMKCYLK